MPLDSLRDKTLQVRTDRSFALQSVEAASRTIGLRGGAKTPLTVYPYTHENKATDYSKSCGAELGVSAQRMQASNVSATLLYDRAPTRLKQEIIS